MQQVPSFDPTAATSGAFSLPLPNGGWLVVMNESVVGLLLDFGDGTTALINPFTIRAMRVRNRQTACAWAQSYTITGAQAPIGLNIVTGECYNPAEWDGGEFILALPRLVNVGNQTGSGTVATLVNDGNAANTQIIEATAAGSSNSNVAITNDGSVVVRVQSNGVLTTVLTITPGGATTPASIVIHGEADSALAFVSSSGDTVTGVSAGSAPNQFFLVKTPQPGGNTWGWGVRSWDGAASHDCVVVTNTGHIDTANLSGGALPGNITVGAAQLTAGAIPAGVTIPGAQVSSAVASATAASSVPATGVTAGALPGGVTIPIGQVTGGAVAAGAHNSGATPTISAGTAVPASLNENEIFFVHS